MNDYVIAIPSYHREESIKYNTLAVLESYNIPQNKIKIFVSDPELQSYQESVKNVEIIPSRQGLINNRDFIRHYFPEGKRIVYMDDDIQGFFSVCDFTDNHQTCNNYKKENIGKHYYKKQIPLPDLHKFIEHSFAILDKENANLGGIYPISNGFFAKHRYTTNLRYIIGAFYLERNIHNLNLKGLDYGEDFERTCMFFHRDKKVIRFESVLLKSAYYKGNGGLVETRTVDKTKEAVELLFSLYPSYLKIIHPTKRNQFWNLKIINKKKSAHSDAESEQLPDPL